MPTPIRTSHARGSARPEHPALAERAARRR